MVAPRKTSRPFGRLYIVVSAPTEPPNSPEDLRQTVTTEPNAFFERLYVLNLAQLSSALPRRHARLSATLGHSLSKTGFCSEGYKRPAA